MGVMRAICSASGRLAHLLGFGATDAAILPRVLFYHVVRDVLVLVDLEGQQHLAS